MPDDIPSSLYTQKISGKGTGLFTSSAIDAGELVFRIERPLLCVPDNRCLSEVCYHCFIWLPGGEGVVHDVATKLLACSGCKVVKYCSKVGRNSSSLRAWLPGFSTLFTTKGKQVVFRNPYNDCSEEAHYGKLEYVIRSEKTKKHSSLEREMSAASSSNRKSTSLMCCSHRDANHSHGRPPTSWNARYMAGCTPNCYPALCKWQCNYY